MFNLLKKGSGILGMNARNLLYVRPSNSKRAIRIADNKLLAKKLLRESKLPVAETHAVIRNRKEVQNFNWEELPNSFVLKPNRGLGGEGILIVYGRKKNKTLTWVKADGSEVRVKDLEEHIFNILDGNFSITNIPDKAFFEERIKILKLLKPYSFRGIPDIRVIVFNNVPIMAELRLPTKDSGGRANLHQGGIGVGIDMGRGLTTTAIQRDKIIENIPKTRLILKGIELPHWKEILELAIEAQKVSDIGFLGVDIAIDRDKGPIILELNAHPGLAIQIANLAPLAERLQRVEGLKVESVKKGVRLAQDLFGGEVEEELEEISGRRVIGINEPIEIIDKEGTRHKTLAKIDTGAYRTTICVSLAKKLGLTKIRKFKQVRGVLGSEKRPIINLSFILDKRLVSTDAFVADRRDMKYDIIVGRRDLKKFLVDPSKHIFMTGRVKRKQEMKLKGS